MSGHNSENSIPINNQRWPVPHISRYGQGAAWSHSIVIRHVGQHIGFLAGLLLAAVAIGIAYRYLFDPLEERTLTYYVRSCLHAIGLTFSG
jgi:hypothetical protein